MERQKRNILWLVVIGLAGITLPTLITMSFYNYVLKEIGVDHAENTRT